MGIIDGIINAGSQLWTNKVNRMENRKQRQWDLKMWNMQNEYNTPENQMQRFKDAGLNPNLMYGQGSSGNAGSVAVPSPYRAEAPQVDFPNMLNVLQSYMDYQLKKEQIVKEQYNIGIARNMFERGHAQNLFDYGDYLMGSSPNTSGYIDMYPKGSGIGDEGYIRKQANLNLAKLKIGNQLSVALNRIREQEAGMSESLKKYNFSAADPWYARAFLRLLDETGAGQLFKRK